MHNASSKVSLVVQRMLFPLLDTPMRTHVLLDMEADQLELDLLEQVEEARAGWGREGKSRLEDRAVVSSSRSGREGAGERAGAGDSSVW